MSLYRVVRRKKGSEMASLTLLQLLSTKFPQLIHTCSISRKSTLRNLRCTSHDRAVSDRISRRLRADLDDADPWVLWSAVVLAVSEVSDPRFELAGVVFPDGFAVGDDLGFAGHGGPFAGGVEEGDVDFRVGLEVVGFAGFSVGVEEEVDTAAFL